MNPVDAVADAAPYTRSDTTVTTRRGVPNSVRVVAADFVSSWIGFTCAVSFAHPLNTLCVRWQTLNRRPIDTLRVDGLRSLYAGVTTPLLFSAPLVACHFALNERFRNVLGGCDTAGSTQQAPSAGCMLAAGSLTGMTMSVVMCPLAFVRIQQQNSAVGGNTPLSFREVAQRTFDRAGIAGFYHAWTMDVVASSTAWMVYFTLYDVFKGAVARFTGRAATMAASEPAPLLESWAAAVATSIATWSLCGPCDLMRNRLQADAARVVPLYRGIAHCVAQTWRADGLRGFWRGAHFTIARSIVSSCIQLPAYDRLKPRLRRLCGAE